MNASRYLTSALPLLLCACSSMAPMPTDIGTGQGTYTFVYESKNSSARYTGAWVNNRPQGQGQVTQILDYGQTGTVTCTGEFTPFGETGANGTGECQDGAAKFQGEFTNLFDIAWVGRWRMGTATFGNMQVTMDFMNGWLYKVPCKIVNGAGRAFEGTCDPGDQHGKDVTAVSWSTTMVDGKGAVTEPDGTRIEGVLQHGTLDGLYTVTHPGQEAMRAFYAGDKLMGEFPSPGTIAKRGTVCGDPGWFLLRGSCDQGRWSGDVEAFTASGGGRLAGKFDAGVPQGDVSLTVPGPMSVVGKLRSPVGQQAAFERGKVFSGTTLVYEGELSGTALSGTSPNGKGVCLFEGSMEECQFLNGQRIDALYKIREENRKQAQRMAQQQQAAANAQARAQQQSSSSSGFQWGKFAAIATGAAIGGVDKLSSQQQAQLLSGAVQDSMGGQQGMSNVAAAAKPAPAASGPTAGAGPTQDLKAKAQACTTEYAGPNSDPQFDEYCKMAAFDSCIHRTTGVTDYDAEGRTACNTLHKLLNATTGGQPYSCGYCNPYPY